jgi:hypothetical protein
MGVAVDTYRFANNVIRTRSERLVAWHLRHDLGTLDFNRAVTDPQIIGNDLVGLSGNETIKDLALTARKRQPPGLESRSSPNNRTRLSTRLLGVSWVT